MFNNINKSNIKFISVLTSVSGLVGFITGYYVKSVMFKNRKQETDNKTEETYNKTEETDNTKEETSNTTEKTDNTKEETSNTTEKTYENVSVDKKTGEINSSLTILDALRQSM